MYSTEMKSGTQVRFKLSSVVCPDRQQIVENITNHLNLTGKVVQLSDAGEKQDFYAIVYVDGINNPLIVPTGEIEICSSPPEDGALM